MFKFQPMRRAMAALLAAALLLSPMAARAMADDGSAPSQGSTADANRVSMTGQLLWVTDLETPHYEINGVVIMPNSSVSKEALEALVGKQVTVFGAPQKGPSIFMKSVLTVTSIQASPEASGSTTPDADVHLQPLHGSQSLVIYGDLKSVVGIYRTDLMFDGHLVFSNRVDLKPYVGHRLAAIVNKNPSSTGEMRYEVLSVVEVTSDLSTLLGANDLYLRPTRAMKLNILGALADASTPVIMGNGRAMLPLRQVATLLGAADSDIHWDSSSQTATVTVGDRTVIVQLGSNLVTMKVKGLADQQLTVDVAPVVLNGSTMVPLRILSEGLGAQVGWDEASATITVTK